MSSFAETYASMADDDLVRLSNDIASLLPAAREALSLEMQRREIPVDGLDWSTQPPTEEVEKPKRLFRKFLRNFLVFIACDLVYLILVLGVTSLLSSVDFISLVQGITAASLRLSLILAIWTVDPILLPKRFAPQKVKTLWIIGFVAPPVAGLLLGTVVLLHLGQALDEAFWPIVILWLAFDWWQNRRK